MKKNILIMILFFMSIALLSTSCKKEQSSTKSNLPSIRALADSGLTIDAASTTGVSVTTYGFLKFDSPSDYESVLDIIKNYNEEQLDLWESTLNYVSSRTAYQSPESYGVTVADNNNTYIEDELFHSIIDKYGMIQVGDYLLKSEFDIDRVLEINIANYPANQTAFDAGTFNPLTMNELDSETETEASDDIFNYLAAGTVGATKTTASAPPTWILDPINHTEDDCEGGKNNGCDSKGNSCSKNTHALQTDPSSAYWRADCKAVYQRAVFYFSLITKMKYQKGSVVYTAENTDIWFNQNIQNGYITYAYLEPKRKSSRIENPPYHVNYGNQVHDNKLSWRSYAAGRKLKKYDQYTTFGFIDICGGFSTVKVRTSDGI